ncbi:MAG: ImmA/IrrE family metallo-endopeptidase [Bacteroidetes bacterium]|nr:ImmA/IrrE family metallo-endopeptidase [Bacteroidota bacterium]MBL6943176.1 ImmA/IrrE family metallo-endopeptidase [Bacteroidales bacterium]
MTEQEIKQEAFELRRKFGFSGTEPIRLKSLLLKEEILTYFTPLDDDFSGMAIEANSTKFLIINSNHSLGRQHFTICHELYHLFVDEDFTPHRCQTATFNKANKSEYWADTFASHFLLPESGVLAEIPKNEWRKDKIKLATIIKIEQYYACSRRALINRLLHLRLVSPEYRNELIVSIKKTAQMHGYPINQYEAGNEGEFWGDYGSLAKELFDNELISEGKYASLMKDIGIDIFENLDDNGD